MKKRLILGSLLLLQGILFSNCSDTSENSGTHSKTQLRVALFPYIPDAANDTFLSLEKKIEYSFEKSNPDIDLILRRFDPMDNFYDDSTIVSWLTTDSGYDLVEIDAILLDKIVQKGVIGSWPDINENADWHPAAKQAVVLNGKTYGVPHLLCGYFLFSTNEKIARSKNASELIQNLKDAKTPMPNLYGNYVGSWTLPTLYLDAWEDTYNEQSIEKAIFTTEPDVAVASYLKALCIECQTGDTNPCLLGAFDDNPDSLSSCFAKNGCDAVFGYSETMFNILRHETSKRAIFIESMPMGNGNTPVLFTDMLVLRTTASAEVKEAAAKFTSYLTLPDTYEMLMMSQDAPKESLATPRYIIPATKSAFNAITVQNDAYYRQIENSIQNGISYPNNNYAVNRKNMNTILQKQLKDE